MHVNKKGLVWNEIAWWVIGLVLLALIAVFIFILSKQGNLLIDKIKEFFMFGR